MRSTNKPKPIPGEKELISSDTGMLSLSNYRVKFDVELNGATKYVSIPLDAISSCSLVTRSIPALLVVPAVAILFALTQEFTEKLYPLLLVGAGFVAAYFYIRGGVISISPSGGENLLVPVKGMSREQILHFLEAVTEARLRYSGKIKD